ncbi:hypothetical protein WME75_09825 [Sorangium sp. So ce1014]|uniref:hypothetical protein n=1 Tax=Sorangium sp. So ce1014 TaxID=3133326 RepID=UPI003F623107
MKKMLGRLAIVGLLTGVCFLDAQRDGAGIAHAGEATASERRDGRFQGSYGWDAAGSLVGLGNFVANGVIVFHRNGTLTATESGSLDGTYFTDTFTGTWTLDEDGTGTFTTVDSAGGISIFDWVLTANGQRGTAVSRDTGDVSLLRMERQ